MRLTAIKGKLKATGTHAITLSQTEYADLTFETESGEQILVRNIVVSQHVDKLVSAGAEGVFIILKGGKNQLVAAKVGDREVSMDWMTQPSRKPYIWGGVLALLGVLALIGKDVFFGLVLLLAAACFLGYAWRRSKIIDAARAAGFALKPIRIL